MKLEHLSIFNKILINLPINLIKLIFTSIIFILFINLFSYTSNENKYCLIYANILIFINIFREQKPDYYLNNALYMIIGIINDIYFNNLLGISSIYNLIIFNIIYSFIQKNWKNKIFCHLTISTTILSYFIFNIISQSFFNTFNYFNTSLSNSLDKIINYQQILIIFIFNLIILNSYFYYIQNKINLKNKI